MNNLHKIRDSTTHIKIFFDTYVDRIFHLKIQKEIIFQYVNCASLLISTKTYKIATVFIKEKHIQ